MSENKTNIIEGVLRDKSARAEDPPYWTIDDATLDLYDYEEENIRITIKKLGVRRFDIPENLDIDLLYRALSNCRLLAARLNRKEPNQNWQHILRFCEEAGVKGSPLR